MMDSHVYCGLTLARTHCCNIGWTLGAYVVQLAPDNNKLDFSILWQIDFIFIQFLYTCQTNCNSHQTLCDQLKSVAPSYNSICGGLLIKISRKSNNQKQKKYYHSVILGHCRLAVQSGWVWRNISKGCKVVYKVLVNLYLL